MDGFRDSITKELDAQTMIDANSAADAKEIDELKAQNAGYETAISHTDDKIDKLGKDLTGKMSSVSEETHKDCIRVYRNVQASMIEELDKRTEKLTSQMDGIEQAQQAHIQQQTKFIQQDPEPKAVKCKGMTAVIVLQVITMLMAAAAAAISIITYMGIRF